jgi:hypothetical protein
MKWYWIVLIVIVGWIALGVLLAWLWGRVWKSMSK